MSNHSTQLDLLESKLNEVIDAVNELERIMRVRPKKILHVGEFSEELDESDPRPPVKYPAYNRSKIDHSTLGG